MEQIDLYNKKYDRETLKEHIYELNFIDILKTQVLDEKFIVKYILNDKYRLHKDDEYITVSTVLKYQPHITIQDMLNASEEYNTDDDNDSIEDFESYAENH